MNYTFKYTIIQRAIMKLKYLLILVFIMIFSCTDIIIQLNDHKKPEDPNTTFTSMPEINGVVNGEIYTSSVKIYWDEDSTKARYIATIDSFEYKSGDEITSDGLHTFSLQVEDTDPYFNETVSIDFLIDKNGSDTQITTNSSISDSHIQILFNKGPEFVTKVTPLYAIWIEDTTGNFIQNLFVCQAPATNVMRYNSAHRANPQALPYWSHKACIEAEYWISKESNNGSFMSENDSNAELDLLHLSIPSSEPNGPIPADLDAVTGPTVFTDFILISKYTNSLDSYKVNFEINKSYDTNSYFNSFFSTDKYYAGSEQPSLIYSATIDLTTEKKIYEMELIGAGHHSGRDGILYTTQNHTTALDMVESLFVILK